MLWVNAVVALGPCLPFIHGWITKDPVHVMQFHAAYNFILRFDTRHGIGKPFTEES